MMCFVPWIRQDRGAFRAYSRLPSNGLPSNGCLAMATVTLSAPMYIHFLSGTGRVRTGIKRSNKKHFA